MRRHLITAVSAFLLSACGSECGSDTEEPQVVPSTDSGFGVGLGVGSCGSSCPEDAGAAPEDADGNGSGGGDEDDGGAPVSTGNFAFSHDWLPEQGVDFIGEEDTTLYDSSCEPIAVVSEAFAQVLYDFGQGRLASGVAIESEGCSCSVVVPTEDLPPMCWSTLDEDLYPWSKGPYDRSLVPLRSVGMDMRLELGTSIYIPKWDGIVVPTIGGTDGFLHDGCFTHDYWMGASQTDVTIFYGSKKMSDYFLDYFGADIFGDISVDDPECQ